jgi:hypothetical protein
VEILIQIHRQQCDFISIILFFQNKESTLKILKELTEFEVRAGGRVVG